MIPLTVLSKNYIIMPSSVASIKSVLSNGNFCLFWFSSSFEVNLWFLAMILL